MTALRLKGRRILAVEDDYFTASDLLDLLEENQAQVYGPVSHMDTLTQLTGVNGPKFDAVILDINLHGALVFPVAEVLHRRKTPIVFVTAYDRAAIPRMFQGVACFRKPYDAGELLAHVAALIGATDEPGLAC